MTLSPDKPKPSRFAGFIRKIERHKKKLAAERDELRELISDLEAIEETASDAIEHLDLAIEGLSQYV